LGYGVVREIRTIPGIGVETMRWWSEVFLAMRFIVLGAALFVIGALLTYVAKGNDPEVRVVGVIIFVAGVGMMVLGVVVWPRTRSAEPDYGLRRQEAWRKRRDP